MNKLLRSQLISTAAVLAATSVAITPEEEARIAERAKAREAEKEQASEGEVRVSGVSGLKVGDLLRDKRDPTAAPMIVTRIHKEADIAVLKPYTGNRRQRRAHDVRAGRSRIRV